MDHLDDVSGGFREERDVNPCLVFYEWGVAFLCWLYWTSLAHLRALLCEEGLEAGARC